MALNVKRITLWRKEVENRPGALAAALEPLADAGADLCLVMGYRFPDQPERSAIEVYPVTGKRQAAAAEQAGLAPFELPCLLIEGPNQAGFGARLGRALSDAGINIAFLVAGAVGRNAMATIGFADAETAERATKIVRGLGRAAPASRRRPARRRRR
jgi:hypothetical protein